MPVVDLRGQPWEGDNQGAPPEPPDMTEARIAKLEAIAEKTGERLGNIERDIAVMRSESTRYATKEDLHRELHGQTMKLGAAIILAQLLPAIPAFLRALHLVA